MWGVMNIQKNFDSKTLSYLNLSNKYSDMIINSIDTRIPFPNNPLDLWLLTLRVEGI